MKITITSTGKIKNANIDVADFILLILGVFARGIIKRI
jgi:hypothetical protein